MQGLTVMIISVLVCVCMANTCPDGKNCDDGQCCRKFFIGNGYWCCRGIFKCQSRFGVGYCFLFSEPYLNQTSTSPEINSRENSRSEMYPERDSSDSGSYPKEKDTHTHENEIDKDEDARKTFQPYLSHAINSNPDISMGETSKSGPYSEDDLSNSESYPKEKDTHKHENEKDKDEDARKTFQPYLSQAINSNPDISMGETSKSGPNSEDDLSDSRSDPREDNIYIGKKSKVKMEDIEKRLQTEEKVLFADAVINALFKENKADPEEF